jgi:hypothetical protein
MGKEGWGSRKSIFDKSSYFKLEGGYDISGHQRFKKQIELLSARGKKG